MGKRLCLAALGAVFVVGCGGGSGSGASNSGGESPIGSVNQYGPIETRAQVNGNPIVHDLSTISTVALAGVVTDATYRPQGLPDNETAIAVAQGNGDIEFTMESGEKVGSIRPPQSDPDAYVIYPRWSPDGQKLFYQATQGNIYSVNVANPASPTTVISATGIRFRYALSPDATKIAYTRVPTGETDTEVFVRDVAGGPTKRLTTNDTDEILGVWADNDRLLVYQGLTVDPGTRLFTVSTNSSTDYSPRLQDLYPVGGTAKGDYFLNSGSTDPGTHGLSLSQRFAGTSFSSNNVLGPETSGAQDASESPDGRRWAVMTQKGVFTTEILPETTRSVLGSAPAGYAGLTWQPPLGVTKFVGSGGKVGTNSSGIIASFRTGSGRNGLASFVSWEAQTPSTSQVNDDATAPGAGAQTYLIEADRLTALRYANRPLFQGTNTVNSGGTANGAIVTVETATGVVRSIVVYQETRGAKPKIRQVGAGKSIEGTVTGVWDATGHNLAPNGASRVQLDEIGRPTLG